MLSRLSPADLRRGLESVHLWHLAVHQYGAIPRGPERRESLPSAANHVNPMPELLEHAAGNLPIELVVLDDQNRSGARLDSLRLQAG